VTAAAPNKKNFTPRRRPGIKNVKKAKFALDQTMNAQRKSRDIALLFL
jgi:hypothetical protein